MSSPDAAVHDNLTEALLRSIDDLDDSGRTQMAIYLGRLAHEETRTPTLAAVWRAMSHVVMRSSMEHERVLRNLDYTPRDEASED